MEPIKEFSKVVLSQDNYIIPEERLRNTPSVKDGCPRDLEVNLRIVGCEQIQTAGKLLDLPQLAMSTAQVCFQRFFYAKSLVQYSMMVSFVNNIVISTFSLHSFLSFLYSMWRWRVSFWHLN